MEDAEEQIRYDRQIRLWGRKAQQNMRNTKVVVVNLGGLAVEIVKNLVLTGIGAVHVLDGCNATEQDLGVNYFLEASDVGRNRATAAADRIRGLNPLVEVICEEAAPETKPDDFWTAFDVVCLTECTLSFQQRIDRLVRQAGRAFVGCNSFGLLALNFLDFGDRFSYVTNIDGQSQEHTATFVPLSAVFQSKEWHRSCPSRAGSRRSRAADRPSRALLACQVLLQAQESVGRELTLQSLEDVRDQLASHHGFAASELPSEYLSDLLGRGQGEFSPVCTVVGGAMAQEIFKVPQRNHAPLNNYVVYDALDCDLRLMMEHLP